VSTTVDFNPKTQDRVWQAADSAARAIPPVWPLASSVAVNPFLGQTGEDLATAGARLARVAGTPVTMDREWYAARIDAGEITDEDLAAALDKAPAQLRPADIGELKAAMRTTAAPPLALPTIAELAAEASGLDWQGVVATRISTWAGGYFDQGQALWEAQRSHGAFSSWRRFATYDLTPEITGLKGFASRAVELPLRSRDTLMRLVEKLGLEHEQLETYFHSLLMSLGGWSQYGRYQLWQAELNGESDMTLVDLLTIRLVWEVALLEQYEHQIGESWESIRMAHGQPVEATRDGVIDSILQTAAEYAAQRSLANTLGAPALPVRDSRPALQAAFCIDVRSEVFRRALESVDPGIQTLGFAGFFGLSTAHRGFASDVVELRLPVLLNPGLETVSGGADEADADLAQRYRARATRAWGRFKLAAVSSFAFVEANGPVYALKLVRDALGLPSSRRKPEPAPRPATPLDLNARVDAAETVLRAMSLTDDFAPVVLLIGHGANVVNNPHASALHCGACGGYTGEVNARLLAGLLNDKDVRKGLIDRGITLPGDTLFVGGLHDTTTDRVQLYTDDHYSRQHGTALKQTDAWLSKAGSVARAERALRLPRAEAGDQVISRSRDWSEVRPEWALAGCQAFIAAPRHRTAGKSLQGRAFLHDYDWQQDKGFPVLELILTAPVVVASWISLQYYGSSVAPRTFGAGNKLLHNVVGGIGVVEGNGGLLRAGLPWQSVHDGEGLAHDPLRLTVCIEAPREAMSAILERHPGVRELFDNCWLYLYALDEDGQMRWRYDGDLQWTDMRGLATSDSAQAGNDAALPLEASA